VAADALAALSHVVASFKRLGVSNRAELVWRVLTAENEKLRAEVVELQGRVDHLSQLGTELAIKNAELQRRDDYVSGYLV
jgi:hypothetical protein